MNRQKRQASPTLGIWALAATVLALQIAIGSVLREQPLLAWPVLDDAEFQRQAASWSSSGSGLPGLPQGSPLYPIVIAWLPGVASGAPFSLLLAQALAGAASALLVGLWARRAIGATAGLVAAGVCLLDPVAAVFAARYSPVPFATLALALSGIALDAALRRSTFAAWLRCGAPLGVGLLLSPLPFAIFALFAGRLAWIGRGVAPRESARALRLAGATGPAVVLAAMMVVAHATALDGAPVFTWGSGPALQQSFDPETLGTPRKIEPPAWSSTGTRRAETWEALAREGTNADVFRFNAVRGLQQIVENPVNTLLVTVAKTGATLSAWPVPDALSPGFLLDRAATPLGWWAWIFAFVLGAGIAGAFAISDPTLRSAAHAGLLSVGIACLLGPTSAAIRQLALPFLALGVSALVAAFVAPVVAAVGSVPRTRLALGAAAISAVSLVAAALSPAKPLRNPSEDLRLEANSYFERGATAEGERRLQLARRADPTNVEVLLQIALSSLREGLLEEGEATLAEAAAIDSNHVGVLLARAQLAQGRNDLDSAMLWLSRIVVAHPNNPRYLNELGQLLARVGRIPDAIDLFARALRIKPDYGAAQTNLEAMESMRQRLEESLYPPEMRLAPDDPVDRAVSAIVLAMNDERWSEADSLISWTEQERSDHIVPHWLRAAYHVRRQEPQLAIAALERCDRLAPARPAVIEMLAKLYEETGRSDDARRLIENAITLAAHDSIRRAALEQLRDE